MDPPVFEMRGSHQWVECDIVRLKSFEELEMTWRGSRCLCGIVDLKPSTEWQPIDSLSAQERITHVIGSVKIRRCLRDNLYYVRTTRPLKLQFLLSRPKEGKIPEKIESLIDECRRFGKNPFSFDPSLKEDCLTQLLAAKTGSCTWRTVAFWALMKERHPEIPIHALESIPHSFVEIFNGQEWVICDLDGTPADFQISSSNNPKEELSSFREIQLVDNTQPANRSFLEDIKQMIGPQRKVLIKLQTADELEALDYWLRRHSPLPVRLMNLSNLTESEMAAIELPDEALVALYDVSGSKADLDEDLVKAFHCKTELLSFAPNCLKPGAPASAKKNFSRSLFSQMQQTIWGGVTFGNSASTDVSQLLTHVRHGKNSLLEIGSLRELDAIVFQLLQHTPHAYYIDTPDDVRCATRWIKLAGDKGEIRPGPGGPLHDFLSATHDSPPVLIVNFSSFDADDISRLNTLIDHENRKADGTPIPENAAVVGLTLKGGYRGADFIGRFHHRVGVLPFSPSEGRHLFCPPQEKSAKINLFESENYRQILLGYWSIEQNSFVYKRGALEKAIERGHTSIEIQNGPWHLRSFRLFWQQALLQRKIQLPGKVLVLPEKISLTTHQETLEPIQWVKEIPEGVKPYVLNSITASEFLLRYQLSDGKLTAAPGWIKENRNKEIYVYQTETLFDNVWQRIAKQCKKYHVTLNIVKGPYKLDGLILTDNIDKTVLGLVDKLKKVKVLEISECDTRILSSLDVKWEDSLHFRFENREGALVKALAASENVILKGIFSKELIAALMPLSLQGQKNLFLVTDSSKGFEMCEATQEKHGPGQISVPEKMITQDRLEMVRQGLARAPHLLIEGPTGVGKSTFVKTILDKQFDLFIGLSSIPAWAACEGKPLLFIDEANLQNTHFSLFEGLYHRSPGIVYEGQYYPLDSKHKVIFASNPISYGGERKTPTFFERHINSVTFAEMPSNQIEEEIIRPLLNKLPEDEVEAICKIILDVYSYVQRLSLDAVVLTARELEMMALVALAASSETRMERLHFSVYQITKNALPKSHQSDFIEWFGEVKVPKEFPEIRNYLLTASRKEAYGVLRDLLDVRHLRMRTSQKGGLGGMVLEGEAGEGKSHFAAACLEAHGFKEILPHDKIEGSNLFCRLPASISPQEKKELLLKFFDAGIIVIEDEANSAPRSESLKNALLMGVDEHDNLPKKPGFLLIETQNPLSYSGRRKTSLAHLRRTIRCEFIPYSGLEMRSIIKSRFPTMQDRATRIVIKQFEKACQVYTEKPTFRDLLTVAERGSSLLCRGVEPLPEPLTQHGHTCKIYALSLCMTWLYKKSLPRYPQPLAARKRDLTVKPLTSLRSLAKKMGSKVGEIYSIHTLVQLAQSQGFSNTHILKSSPENYIKDICACIDQGKAPIIFFDVNKVTGLPTEEASKNEHAALITGYFEDIHKELFFHVSHWGKFWIFNAAELMRSADNLLEDRTPETFYKVDRAWRAPGDRLDHQTCDLQAAIASKRYTKMFTPPMPATQEGHFRNKILVVE